MNRKQQQQDLIYKLGLWLSPILHVAQSPADYTREERIRIRASAHRDHQAFHNAVHDFCYGERGHAYAYEWGVIGREIGNIASSIENSLVDSPETLLSRLEHLRPQVINGVLSIPVAVNSTACEAYTPFSTYCTIRTLCDTTSSNLIFMDRYVNGSLLYRYFSHLPASTALSILTWPRSSHGSKGDYDAFIDVSRIYATERGPTKYRLVENASIHDRWLRCDDQLYHLGGSAKDAGQRSLFTISKLEPTPANFQKLNDLIGNGRELFGPSNPSHP